MNMKDKNKGYLLATCTTCGQLGYDELTPATIASVSEPFQCENCAKSKRE